MGRRTIELGGHNRSQTDVDLVAINIKEVRCECHP